MEDFDFGLETRELEARGLDLDLEEEDDLFEGLEEDLDEEPLFGAIVNRVARVCTQMWGSMRILYSRGLGDGSGVKKC